MIITFQGIILHMDSIIVPRVTLFSFFFLFFIFVQLQLSPFSPHDSPPLQQVSVSEREREREQASWLSWIILSWTWDGPRDFSK